MSLLSPLKSSSFYQNSPQRRHIPEENLTRMSFSEFSREYSPILKNPKFLYEALEDEGYYLPSKKCFSVEWVNLWLKGEKDFLKRAEIQSFDRICQEELDWKLILDEMDDPKVSRYFYHDDRNKPDLLYFYTVIETVDPEWRENKLYI